MPIATVRIAYVDDVAEDLREYTRRLSRVEGVTVQPFWPRASLRDLLGEIADYDPDLELVDIKLELVQPSGESASYGGTGLGSELRAKHPDRPIVLISNPGTPPPDVLVAFDGMLYKDEVAKDPGLAAQHLRALALGYRELRQALTRNAKSLFRVTGAQGAEGPQLIAAGPPLGGVAAAEQLEASCRAPGEWGVVDAARWIRGVVLKYPGIVYDAVHAATALGLEVKSFLRDGVQEWLAPSRYTGVFAPPEGRWWRGRLMSQAAGLMRQAKVTAPVVSGFRGAYNRQKQARLRPSVCVSGGKGRPDCVCYILRQPVMRQYSLIYNPDDRPPVMDHARVSFRAVLEDDRFRPELLTVEGRSALKHVRAEARH